MQEVAKIEKALSFIIDEVENTVPYYDEILKLVKNEGLWLEFGVFTGRTINYISLKTQQKVYGFDSFLGLRDSDDELWSNGQFNLDGNIPNNLRENVVVIPGFFEDVLDDFLGQYTESAAFIHIDCDLYKSSRFVLKTLRERIVPGTIIAFDEIYNFDKFRKSEMKAWLEFVEETGVNYKWIAKSMRVDSSFENCQQAACIII
jgi:hypothetical protein